MARIPLSAIALALYLVGAFALSAEPPTNAAPAFFAATALTVALVSGQVWSLTYADALLAVALAMLCVSVMRAALARQASVAGGLVAVLVLGVHVVLFLVVGAAGTSLFFVLTAISLVEALATVTIAMATDRHAADSPHTV